MSTCIGLYDKTDGQVLYKGTDVHALNGKERFAFKKQVQMVFQDPYGSLDPRMTVADIIGEGIDIHHLAKNKKERQEMIYKYLELVGLNREHANRFVHEFSGGQRQRIGAIRWVSVVERKWCSWLAIPRINASFSPKRTSDFLARVTPV